MPTHQITPELLKAVVPAMPARKRELYAPLIQAAMLEFGITNELRAAAFLAQCAHEADNFRTLEEYASGKAYEGRRDLGNTQPGDGARFKGRGAIQLTGRANYRDAGRALDLPLLDNPKLAAEPENAFRLAGWFWQKHGLNPLADRRQFKAITRIINGGYNGLEDRVQKYERALRFLPDDFTLDPEAERPADEESADYSHEDLQPRASADPARAQAPEQTPAAAPAPQPAAVEVKAIAPAPPAPKEPEDGSIQGRAKKLATQVKAWQVAIPAAATNFGFAVYKWATDPTHAGLVLALLGSATAVVVVFVIMNFRHSALKTRNEEAARAREFELTKLRETHAFELTKFQAETASDPNAATVKIVAPDSAA